MKRNTAVDPLERRAAQNEFYAGGPGPGPGAALPQLLAPHLARTIPGENRIAGT